MLSKRGGSLGCCCLESPQHFLLKRTTFSFMLGPTNYVLGFAPRKLRAGKPHTLPCYTNEETKASDRKHLSQGWRQAAGGL